MSDLSKLFVVIGEKMHNFQAGIKKVRDNVAETAQKTESATLGMSISWGKWMRQNLLAK
ncbi:hypothetical protein N752_29085 [Desulforamulus aquiferis]|nr:hypothetical protein N752_29085 [Desulforamulus aquiferis]